MSRFRIYLTAAFVFILDAVTKKVSVACMTEWQSIEVFPGVFHITLVYNTGVAFGLFKGGGVFFITLSILVVLFILFYVAKHKEIPAGISFPLGLILGGALGNLADRIRFGYVIDFLDFRVWPVFNIADSCITIGAAILLYNLLTQNVKRKT